MLVCDYDQEGDQIYSVKWYKGIYDFSATAVTKFNNNTVNLWSRIFCFALLMNSSFNSLFKPQFLTNFRMFYFAIVFVSN
jgi:hypothetical protein